MFERRAREREQVLERVALVRAHVHGYRMLEDDGVIAVSLPAWKLQDEFAKMLKYPNRIRSAFIGSVGVRFTPDTMDVVKYLYKHPPVHTEVIQ